MWDSSRAHGCERLCACLLVTDRLSALRNVAQLGSAPALGAGGRRFESSHSDQLMLMSGVPCACRATCVPCRLSHVVYEVLLNNVHNNSNTRN